MPHGGSRRDDTPPKTPIGEVNAVRHRIGMSGRLRFRAGQPGLAAVLCAPNAPPIVSRLCTTAMTWWVILQEPGMINVYAEKALTERGGENPRSDVQPCCAPIPRFQNPALVVDSPAVLCIVHLDGDKNDGDSRLRGSGDGRQGSCGVGWSDCDRGGRHRGWCRGWPFGGYRTGWKGAAGGGKHGEDSGHNHFRQIHLLSFLVLCPIGIHCIDQGPGMETLAL